MKYTTPVTASAYPPQFPATTYIAPCPVTSLTVPLQQEIKVYYILNSFIIKTPENIYFRTHQLHMLLLP